jgi:hypothetical protein
MSYFALRAVILLNLAPKRGITIAVQQKQSEEKKANRCKADKTINEATQELKHILPTRCLLLYRCWCSVEYPLHPDQSSAFVPLISTTFHPSTSSLTLPPRLPHFGLSHPTLKEFLAVAEGLYVLKKSVSMYVEVDWPLSNRRIHFVVITFAFSLSFCYYTWVTGLES